MKKIRNSKRGFTLTEIVLVISIIVILSAASFVGVAATINNAENARKNIKDNHVDSFEESAWNQVKAWTVGFKENYASEKYKPKDTTEDDDSDDDDENSDENNEDINNQQDSDKDKDNNQQDQQNQNQNQQQDQQNQQGGSGSSGSTTDGESSSVSVTFTGNTVVRGTEGSGVMSVTPNSDGSTTVGLLYNQWCDGSVKIWKNPDGTYDIQGVNNGGNVIGNALASKNVIFDWDPINQNKKFTLTNDQVAALESVYGMSID